MIPTDGFLFISSIDNAARFIFYMSHAKDNLIFRRRNSLATITIFSFLFLTIITMNGAALSNGAIIASSYAQESALSPSDTSNQVLMGVAMRGNLTSEKQTEDNEIVAPRNYYEQSFKLIHDAGMNHVRYLFYWESYEKNPSQFMEELETVADTADKWGLKVLYDHHQWHTSSWLESRATGFPSFLFEGNPELEMDSGGNTNDESARIWWTDWWDRSVKDVNGNDGWSLLSQFLTKLVNTLDSHPSTVGYEILSEPQIHSDDQWEKVGQFNTFMVSELRKVTQKTIAFSQQVPASINAPNIDVIPENQAKMVPANKNNVVFKISLYGVSTDSFQKARLDGLVEAAQLADVPLYVGEWNNVVREREGGVFRISPEESDLTQEDTNLFLQDFKRLNVWGWAYWQWNFNSHRVPNFNLILVSENGTVEPTKYYEQLRTAITSVYRQT
jgi:Cellulase (glycosyl hydrolase family 5)